MLEKIKAPKIDTLWLLFGAIAGLFFLSIYLLVRSDVSTFQAGYIAGAGSATFIAATIYLKRRLKPEAKQ